MKKTSRFSVLKTNEYERIIFHPLLQYLEKDSDKIIKETFLLKKENLEHFRYESNFRKDRIGDYYELIETPEIYYNKILPLQKLRVKPNFIKNLDKEYESYKKYNHTFTIKSITFRMILSPEPIPPINLPKSENLKYLEKTFNFPWKFYIYYEMNDSFLKYIGSKKGNIHKKDNIDEYFNDNKSFSRWYSIRQLTKEDLDIIIELKYNIIKFLQEKYNLDENAIHIYTRHNPSIYPTLHFEVIYVKYHTYIYDKKYLYESRIDIDTIIWLLKNDLIDKHIFNYPCINKYTDLITNKNFIKMGNKIRKIPKDFFTSKTNLNDYFPQDLKRYSKFLKKNNKLYNNFKNNILTLENLKDLDEANELIYIQIMKNIWLIRYKMKLNEIKNVKENKMNDFINKELIHVNNKTKLKKNNKGFFIDNNLYLLNNKEYIRYTPIHRRCIVSTNDEVNINKFLTNHKIFLNKNIKDGYYLLQINIKKDFQMNIENIDELKKKNMKENGKYIIELNNLEINKNKYLYFYDNLSKNKFSDILHKNRKNVKNVHLQVKKQIDKKSIVLKKNKKIHKDWKNIYFTKNNVDYGCFVYQLSLPTIEIKEELINENIETLLDLFGCIRFIAWQTNNENNNEKIFNDYFYLFKMNENESNRFIMPIKVSNWLIDSIKEIIKKLKSLENNILKDKYFNVICHKPSQIGFHILFIVYKNYNEYANTYEYEFNHNKRINLNIFLYKKYNNYYINNVVFSITYGGVSNYKKEKYMHLIKKKRRSNKIIDNNYKIIVKRSDLFFKKMKILQKICKKININIGYCIYYNYNIFVLQNSELLEQYNWKLYHREYKIEKNDLIYISTYNIRKIIDNSFQKFKVPKEILSFKKSIEFLYYIINNEKCENILMQVLFEPYNIILDILEILNNYFTIKIINFENISFQKDYYYIYLYEIKNKEKLKTKLFDILSNVEFKSKVSLYNSEEIIRKKILKIYYSNL